MVLEAKQLSPKAFNLYLNPEEVSLYHLNPTKKVATITVATPRRENRDKITRIIENASIIKKEEKS